MTAITRNNDSSAITNSANTESSERTMAIESYLEYTKTILPTMAKSLGRQSIKSANQLVTWPIHNDHCFQRVVLDTICQAPWYDVIPSPAYKNLPLYRISLSRLMDTSFLLLMAMACSKKIKKAIGHNTPLKMDCHFKTCSISILRQTNCGFQAQAVYFLWTYRVFINSKYNGISY